MATQLNLPGIPGGGGVGGAIQGLLGSQAVRSIAEWMMLQQLVQSLLQPLTIQLQQASLHQFPSAANSPADLADGVVRGHLPRDKATDEARKGGYDQNRFQLLLDNAGEPLPLQSLLEAWRRGIIPQAGQGADSVSLEQGIRESRLKDKWIPPIEALQWLILSPADVVAALLRGQIPRDEAVRRARQAGLAEPELQILLDATGRPPSPGELGELLKRGLIPEQGTGPQVLSFQQGIFEGDTKDKWWPMYAALAEYLPPPRTVTAMIREGSLTDQEGLDLFKKAGLSDTLAAAYMTAAHHQKSAATRELTRAEIVAAYKDRLVDAPTATKMLAGINYTEHDAAFELSIADFQLARAEMVSAQNRIKALYLRRRLTRQQSINTLTALGNPTSEIDRLLRTWDLERAAAIPELTAAEVVSAAYYEAITNQEAIGQLQAMGWSPFDAWVLLSNRLHAPPKDIPKPTATIPEPYSG